MAVPKEEERKKLVCVTGGCGFIGSWLVRTLLDHHHSYTVRATVQDLSDPSQTYHLRSLLPSNSDESRLSLFQADLLDSGSLWAAIDGCEGVFHLASPCFLEDPREPQTQLLDPAIQGTLNVLEACRKAKVRRVVLTSSISAMVPNPSWPHDKVVDESCWTDIDFCKAHKKWYPVSKTLAERAAWEFSKQHGLDVVAIHPSTCLGPLLQPSLNASSAVLLQLLQGSEESQEHHWLGSVDVRDVAKAQLLLYETPCASGRYLCTNGIYQFKDFAEIVAGICPGYPLHKSLGDIFRERPTEQRMS
ncbi:cinnamoyl-CoA reductase 1 isoform X2 [Amborella trichopoda]|uniref:cinnamoyl-CoA reductase 1 isoform X2 n=1 Tax=Amborella trichopoda TaxID=13333 RepID=UPI0009BE4FD3|nr:cinnamoyl-CoA reductase 1 isoform X2 [Amborella trichopoda]|eukprot:XP_020519027.1 cinnamoyl-CoA reductase 1 isoform X2 [Amborella trichopoda]